MTALVQDVELEQGSSMTLVFGPVLDDTGSPVDLTGASAKWWMGKRNTASGADVFVMKDSDDGSITIYSALWYNEVQWYVSINILPTDTLGAPPCVHPIEWYHEARITTQDGKVATIATGSFNLIPTIIRNLQQASANLTGGGGLRNS
jgi:hypothetical protein